MKRLRLAVVLASALAALVGSAQGQTTSVVQTVGVAGETTSSGTVLFQLAIVALVQGELVVNFHGDVAAGCAAYGVCSYSGTIVVRPEVGDVSVETVRRGGRIHQVVTLDPALDPTDSPASARVQRSAPGGPAATCADAAPPLVNGQTTGELRGGSVTLKLLGKGGSLLQTRCAGPLEADLSSASPAVTLPLRRLRQGRLTLDFSGTSTFASHGFAGTISSTVRMKLIKPRQTGPSSVRLPRGTKTQRIRTVTEALSLVRVRGRLSASIRGTANPTVCALLDSCGLSGTLSLGNVPRAGSAEVIAVAPARRPYRDFLTALGLSHSGRARGIAVAVLLDWTGRVRATVSQAGATCTDTAFTGGVAFESGLGLNGSNVRGSWRTRCPGPNFGDGTLSASFDRATLGHQIFSVDLRPAGRLGDDGYVIVPHGRLSMLLRRGRITSQVSAEPAG